MDLWPPDHSRCWRAAWAMTSRRNRRNRFSSETRHKGRFWDVKTAPKVVNDHVFEDVKTQGYNLYMQLYASILPVTIQKTLVLGLCIGPHWMTAPPNSRQGWTNLACKLNFPWLFSPWSSGGGNDTRFVWCVCVCASVCVRVCQNPVKYLMTFLTIQLDLVSCIYVSLQIFFHFFPKILPSKCHMIFLTRGTAGRKLDCFLFRNGIENHENEGDTT